MIAKGIKDWGRYKYPSAKKNQVVVTYPQLAVVLDGIFVIFLNIIREVVDGNVVVVNILHDLQKVVG
jgi:hypothetical protein